MGKKQNIDINIDSLEKKIYDTQIKLENSLNLSTTKIENHVQNSFNVTVASMQVLDQKSEETNTKFESMSEKISTVSGSLGILSSGAGEIFTNMANLLSNNGQQASGLSDAFLGIGVALGQMSEVFGFVSTTIIPMIESFQAISGIMAGLSSTTLIIIGVIIALIAIFAILYTSNDEFRQLVDNFVNNTLTLLADFINNQVIPAFQLICEWIQANVVPVLLLLADFITNQVMPAFQLICQWILANVVPALLLLANFIMTTVIPALGQIWSWFKEHILPILEQLFNVFIKKVVPAFAAVAEFILGIVLPVLLKLYTWFAENILPIILKIAGILVDLLKPAFDRICTAIGSVCDTIMNLVSWFREAWKFLEATGVIDAFGAAFEGVCKFIDKIIDGIKWLINNVSNIFGKIDDFVDNVGGFFGDVLGGFFSGGYGDLVGPSNSMNLTTNINVTNTGGSINKSEIIRWGNVITDIVDENLGRRV